MTIFLRLDLAKVLKSHFSVSVTVVVMDCVDATLSLNMCRPKLNRPFEPQRTEDSYMLLLKQNKHLLRKHDVKMTRFDGF